MGYTTSQPILDQPPAKCALFPLFYEKSATPAMIKHGMNVQRQALQYLNPGQSPVITMDLASLLWQSVQWKWSETHGENVVVMLDGLHI